MPIDPSIVLSLPVDATDHARGNPEADYTLVWYGDYECDYCGRTFPIVKDLQRELGDRLQLVYRHFPVASIHPHAAAAAQAAEAAGAQGKFWAMHDLLFAHQDHLAEADFSHYALQVGLEVYKFNADVSSQRFAAKVKRDHESGVASGVRGTPTFFINGYKYTGRPDVTSLAAALAEVTR